MEGRDGVRWRGPRLKGKRETNGKRGTWRKELATRRGGGGGGGGGVMGVRKREEQRCGMEGWSCRGGAQSDESNGRYNVRGKKRGRRNKHSRDFQEKHRGKVITH